MDYTFNYSFSNDRRDEMNLVDARKQARYSQQMVADQLGISRQTYIRMEQNPEDISIGDAKTLAELYGVSVEDIFFDSNCN